ncbi:MAG: molybdopterin guanine dinucleotide synthesis [Rhodobacter sp.]|nr:molybdopterin guanine dinucleotide synthesis [Rhodobacter sp.]
MTIGDGFDRILIVDWSAANMASPRRPSKDAIWVAEAGAGAAAHWYLRTRSLAMELVAARIERALARGERVLCGFDFPFGYPAGFAQVVAGEAGALAVWRWLAGAVCDADDNRSNRFQVAATANAMFPGIGPFWGCPASVSLPGLPAKGRARYGHGMRERRAVEDAVRRAQPCWKLFTTGSVGSQALLGLARLQGLRRRFAGQVAVWPFERLDMPVVLAEIYPSLLDGLVKRAVASAPGVIPDAVQVRLLAATLAEMQDRGQLAAALDAARGEDLAEESWILGVGAETDLGAAAMAVFDGIAFALPPQDHPWSGVLSM